jgi:hypothetical protein
MEFSGIVYLPESSVNYIKERFKLQKINIVNREIYKIDANEYYLRVIFEEKETSEKLLQCHIDFKMSTIIPRPGSLEMKGSVINFLSELLKEKPEGNISINSSFYYSLEKFNSVIPLPFPLPNVNKLNNAEVRGLRMFMKDKNIGEYSQIIDIGSKSWYHNIVIHDKKIELSHLIIENFLKDTFNLSSNLIEEKK